MNRNVYLTNVEGANVLRGKITNNENAMLPFSLFAKEFFKKKHIKVNGNKQFTDIFINISFDKDYFEFDEETNIRRIIMKSSEVREYLYTNGFDFQDKHYIRFGRGAGKARVGQCLFIQEEYYKKAMKIQLAGLKFDDDEEVDLAGLETYRNLIMSESSSFINIKPGEILLVDDIYGDEIKQVMSVTYQQGDELITKPKEVTTKTCITDGSSLGDESIFMSNNALNGHSFALLRNNFFKSAMFNVKLQQFFKDKGIEELTDMFGNTHRAEDIKLIITPNSLKFLKYAYKFKSKEDCYKFWLKNKLEFGVVKVEKDMSHVTTYQLINSLNLNREEIKQLSNEQIETINKMKDNPDFLVEYIGKNNNLLFRLLDKNPDIQYTKEYKEFRKNIVDKHKNELLSGRINLGKETSGYCTMLCNPIEQLYIICGLPLNRTLKGREIYCSKYENNSMLGGWRNPHIMMSNCYYAVNKYYDDFKYLNLNSYIAVVNGWDYNICDTLEGCDFDSDTIMLTSNEILVNKMREINTLIPYAEVEGTKKTLHYNMKDLVDLDNAIYNPMIGTVVNKSAVLNAYYTHYKNTGADEELLQIIFNAISQLDICSRLAIDFAKKQFSINFDKVLRKMDKLSYNGKPIINRVEIENNKTAKVLPLFMSNVVNNKNRHFECLECSMDYLVEEVKKIKKAKRTKTIKINAFLKKVAQCEGTRNPYVKLKIEKLLEDYKRENNFYSITNNCKMKINAKVELYKNLDKLNVSEKVLVSIVKNITFNQLMILYKVYGDKVINCFNNFNK